MNARRNIALCAVLLIAGCSPGHDASSPLAHVTQSVRGHQEIVFTVDGGATPWFIGVPLVAGVCVTPSALVDTSRWRLAISVNKHQPDPTFEEPTARNAATMCLDHTWQTLDVTLEKLCVTVIDDYDGATHQLACQTVRHVAHDPLYAQLQSRQIDLLKTAGTHGIAQRFLALAETANAQQRPVTALRLTLIAAHFERRDAQPDAPRPAAKTQQTEPAWLAHDAAHAIAGQFHYERTMRALRRHDLSDAWRAAVAAYARFGAVAHPKTIVAATRRAQVLLQAGAAQEARDDLARAIAQCRHSVCEDALLRDANSTLAWWLMNADSPTPGDLARADASLSDALINTTGAERANVLLNRAYLHTQTEKNPNALLDEAGALLDKLDGARAQKLRHWHAFILARDAYLQGDAVGAAKLIGPLRDVRDDATLAARTHSLHGRMLRSAGQFEDAQRAFAQAVKQHTQPRPPTQWIPMSPGQRASDYYALALTSVDLGQPNLAWQTLRALDELADAQHCASPSNAVTQQQLVALARTLHNLQGPASAQREAQRAAIRVELRLAQRALARQRQDCGETLDVSADAANLRAFAYDDELVLLRRANDGTVRLTKRTHFGPGELRDRIDLLDAYLGRREINDQAWSDAGTPLAAALLPQPNSELPARTRFALHGQLQRVPIGALPYASGWFADATTVVFTPAGSRQSLLDAEPRSNGVIIVDPSGNFANSKSAGDFFATAFPDATLLQGDAARVDAVTAALSAASWLHVGAHGEADEEFADLFALRMADGLLFSPTLTRDAAGLAFANLSSCRSGRFSLTADSGQWGLAGGLVRAGVPWVIAARHDLEDSAAARFNRDFYTHYQRTGSVPDAYQRASRQLREAFPARIWAGLMLVGNGGGANSTNPDSLLYRGACCAQQPGGTSTMTEEDRLENLAHELARHVPNDTTASGLTDAQLLAYLEGEDSENIEPRLANDSRARDRLAHLAGVAAPNAPADVRSRLLARVQNSQAPRFGWPQRMAAGLALLALGFATYFGLQPERISDAQRAQFAQLDFDVSFDGIANVRGSTTTTKTAYPDSTVTVRATPTISTALPIHIEVFAGAPPNQTRIEPLSINVDRGAVTVRFRPDQIDGLVPGLLRITMVMSLDKSTADTLVEPRHKALFNGKIFDDDILILARQ